LSAEILGWAEESKLIATHFAGPTWQSVKGSSQVVGKREAGVNVEARRGHCRGAGDRLGV
jgi:hypothetical protein